MSISEQAGCLPESLRNDFPCLHQSVHGHPLVYLDSAASAQKPCCVIDAIRSLYEHDYANVHRGLHELSARATEIFEGARESVARFIGASSADEIIFTRGTTESINLVAAAWGQRFIGHGDTILLTEMEHHSNLVPWQMLAERTGARLKWVPVTDRRGILDPNEVEALLTPDVKLFAFTHVSNSLGVINPAARFCAMARERGITSLVDGAQSVGHRPVNVSEIGCDFLAFSGHKMGGPSGVGILYGRKKCLEKMPPCQGGGEMILSVSYEKSSWKPPPHRFEAGTPNIAGAAGLAAAVGYIDKIGLDKIEAHDRALADYAWSRLSAMDGLEILGPESGRAGLVSFLLGDVHAHDLVTFADQLGVALRGGHHCNQPLMRKLGIVSTARASFWLYTKQEEIDRLAEVLGEARRYFSI